MLEQLIESTNHLSNTRRRRGGFLLTAFTAVFTVFTLGLIYSLFSHNLAMANDRLDISSLVAPVPVAADEPPVSGTNPRPQVRTTDHAPVKLQTRVENIQRVTETPVAVPTALSTVPNKNLARPDAPYELSNVDSTESSGSTRADKPGRNSGGGGGSPLGITPPTNAAKDEEIEEKAPPIKTPAPKTVAKPTIVRTSKVLNGQAVNLVKPVYPLPAKAVRASGTVNVQVTIDENGNVATASAVSGHYLLRQVSEQAARSSKFSPTFLGEHKVKVTGVIVYNFIPQ